MSSLFWSSQLLEPKRNFRFIVRFKGMPDQATFYASKCTRPELEISKTEHKYLNHKFSYPARATWNDITITLVDPATPDAIGNLHAIMERSGYLIPGNANVLASISKNQAVSQAGGGAAQGGGGDIEILVLDAAGNTSDDLVLEKWTVRNAWISKITPSELSYDNEDLSTVEMTIVYDWSELKVFDIPQPIHLPVSA